LFTELFVVNF